jgi:GT2 family glycosyltransferase
MSDVTIIAAVIINWNGAADTLELLDSLLNCQKSGFTFHIAVIDNASKADDLDRLRQGIYRFNGSLKITLRENSVNVGVPAAYNQGIQLLGVHHEYYLRLDNDVTVNPLGLKLMIAALRGNEKTRTAIVGGNVKYYHRPTENNGGAVGIDLLRGKTTVTYPDQDVVCDGVLGCIMLVDGVLVRKYSPEVFDSRLFICTDESELSLRAKRDGFLTFYVAAEIGLHKGGVSTGKVNFLSKYYSARNWILIRVSYTSGLSNGFLLLGYFMYDALKCGINRRWVYHLGLLSGLAAAVTQSVDSLARRPR